MTRWTRPENASPSRMMAMSRGCRIYCRISMAARLYSIHNHRCSSLGENHARKGERGLHDVSHLMQVVCQWRPSTTAVFTVFWWYCVHTHFETYYIRYISNVQCGQVIQASFQKTQVTEHPSKLMQCCPPGMSSGCRLYCRLNMEGLPYSIPNYDIFVIQEQPV